jgi:hypothetical protein
MLEPVVVEKIVRRIKMTGDRLRLLYWRSGGLYDSQIPVLPCTSSPASMLMASGTF